MAVTTRETVGILVVQVRSKLVIWLVGAFVVIGLEEEQSGSIRESIRFGFLFVSVNEDVASAGVVLVAGFAAAAVVLVARTDIVVLLQDRTGPIGFRWSFS